jgi:hypothetical protein
VIDGGWRDAAAVADGRRCPRASRRGSPRGSARPGGRRDRRRAPGSSWCSGGGASPTRSRDRDADDVVDGSRTEAYLRALDELGVGPVMGEAVAFEDTEAGVASAKAAGSLPAVLGTLDRPARRRGRDRARYRRAAGRAGAVPVKIAAVEAGYDSGTGTELRHVRRPLDRLAAERSSASD